MFSFAKAPSSSVILQWLLPLHDRRLPLSWSSQCSQTNMVQVTSSVDEPRGAQWEPRAGRGETWKLVADGRSFTFHVHFGRTVYRQCFRIPGTESFVQFMFQNTPAVQGDPINERTDNPMHEIACVTRPRMFVA